MILRASYPKRNRKELELRTSRQEGHNCYSALASARQGPRMKSPVAHKRALVHRKWQLVHHKIVKGHHKTAMVHHKFAMGRRKKVLVVSHTEGVALYKKKSFVVIARNCNELIRIERT